MTWTLCLSNTMCSGPYEMKYVKKQLVVFYQTRRFGTANSTAEAKLLCEVHEKTTLVFRLRPS